MYLVLSKFLIHEFSFGRITHKGLKFLPSLYPIKYLKLFSPKATLLDTSTLLTFTSFIEMGLLCQ